MISDFEMKRAESGVILENVKDHKKLLFQMEQSARNLLDRKIKEFCPDLIEEGFFFYFSGWDCEKSPITKCVYTYSGMGEDECIFCHQPEERK